MSDYMDYTFLCDEKLGDRCHVQCETCKEVEQKRAGHVTRQGRGVSSFHAESAEASNQERPMSNHTVKTNNTAAQKHGAASGSQKLSGRVFYVPIELATSPTDGEVICRAWWTVHPEKGLAFYFQPFGYSASESPSPQCNHDQHTAEYISTRLYPNHELRQVPVVFMERAEIEMRRQKKII